MPPMGDKSWRHQLGSLAYFGQFPGFSEWVPTKAWADVYEIVLNLYAASRDSDQSAGARFNTLKLASVAIESICKESPSFVRLLAAARIFSDLGCREKAAQFVLQAAAILLQGGQIDLDEPVLCPISAMEQDQPGEQLADWLVTAVLIARETMRCHSFFFTAAEALQIMAGLANNPWIPEGVRHRLELALKLNA